MVCRRLIKLPEVANLSGLKTTSIYAFAKAGLLPPPIKLTPKSSVWVEDEIAAVNAARIAGKSNDDIRQLVAELMAARTIASPGPLPLDGCASPTTTRAHDARAGKPSRGSRSAA